MVLTLSMLSFLLLVVKYCSLSLSVISFGASSIPPLQRICSCILQDLGKTCAHSFCMTFAGRGRQAILPPTFGFVTCAQTACPCFTRPRFELGLSSHAPQVSAQRVRLSCSIKSRVFSFMRHHVPNVGRPRHACRHHRLNQWSSRLVSSMTRSWTLHASSCGCIRVRLDRVFLNCLRPVRHPLPWHSMATSSSTNSSSILKLLGHHL